MSCFIKVTEIRTITQGGICSTFREDKIPVLINTGSIMKIEDNIIHLIDFKIKVEESLEQIQELLNEAK